MSPSQSGPSSTSGSSPDTTTSTDADPARADKRRGLSPGYLLAAAVLVGSLVLLGLFWRNARQNELLAGQVEFVAEANDVVARLTQRMMDYELALRGGAALFGTVARPTPSQWKSYVDGLALETRFPAMLGLGFAPQVTVSGLTALQLDYRASGHGLLTVRPRGIREIYGPVLYLEPKTPENVMAFGFDMYSRPVRRAAMEAARDSGKSRLSGAVELVQNAGEPGVGVLLYVPVYRAGDQPGSRAARRLSMQGWVYAPFRLQTLVETRLGKRRGDMRFRVHDITDGGNTLLYADSPNAEPATSAFTHSVVVKTLGRDWRFDFQSGPAVEVLPRLLALRNNMLLGGLISLLLFGVALLLARTEAKASKMAERMTENYRRSERRFRNALQYSAFGQALLDHDGRIVEANPALATLFGRSQDSLAGTQFSGLFEVDGSEPVEDMQAVADGVFRINRHLRRDDGEIRHATLTYTSVPGKLGQDVSRLVQVEDATERMRAENRVQALNRTLEARVALRTRELSTVNRELETFAYSVSHDLRAPLRAIDGFSRLLVERHGGQLDDSGRDYLDRVRKASGRMGDLIESILKMSRLSRSQLRLTRLDLSAMAQDVVRDLREAAPGRLADVVIAPDLSAGGDPSLVRNLLQNLLENAWKFTGDCEQARIEFGEGPPRSDGTREFFVRDNGAGFPQEYADKLFRPFQRLHSQEQFAGHGIGLASVKRIVERHGGELRGESGEGQGATFWFTLPKFSEPSAETGPGA